jgi:hypothetical protein
MSDLARAKQARKRSNARIAGGIHVVRRSVVLVGTGFIARATRPEIGRPIVAVTCVETEVAVDASGRGRDAINEAIGIV